MPSLSPLFSAVPLTSPSQKKFYFADGAKDLLDLLAESGEPILPLTQHVLDNFVEIQTTEQNWKLNYRRDKLRAMYHASLCAAGIDVLLCPSYVGVAPEVGTPTYWLYTALWNVLDLPALVFPTGLKVDQELDVVDKDYKTRSDLEAFEYGKCEFIPSSAVVGNSTIWWDFC